MISCESFKKKASWPAFNVGQIDGREPAQALDEEEDRVGQLGRSLRDDIADVVDLQNWSPKQNKNKKGFRD